MTHHPEPEQHVRRPPRPRARRSFWLLVTAAVLATGVLSNALTAEPSPITGMRVAISGSVLILSLALAARVMIALERARKHASATTCPTPRREPRRESPAP